MSTGLPCDRTAVTRRVKHVERSTPAARAATRVPVALRLHSHRPKRPRLVFRRDGTGTGSYRPPFLIAYLERVVPSAVIPRESFLIRGSALLSLRRPTVHRCVGYAGHVTASQTLPETTCPFLRDGLPSLKVHLVLAQ
jgi:hypothetical protein